MKKLTFILAGLVLATGAFAQKDKGFSYGVKAGVNVTTLSDTKDIGEDYERKAKTGAYMGVMAAYKFNKVVGLQLEAIYSRQGGTWLEKDPAPTDKVRMSFKMDYVNIPLMVKLYPCKRLSIDFGPQFGFLVRGYMIQKIAVGDASPPETKNLIIKIREKIPTDYRKGFDLSLGLGVTCQIYKGLEASVRYNFGLTDVFDSDEIIGDASAKNRVLQIGMGYRF